MALKGEKHVTLAADYKGQHYDLGKFKTFSGGEQTMGSAKTRAAAGQARKARNGLDDVGNVTIGREDDGTLDLKWLWSIRRGNFSITFVPDDGEGNPRAKDSATYTGKLIRLERGEGDAEEDEDIDTFELEFNCDSAVS
jgi:hypothetical protein